MKVPKTLTLTGWRDLMERIDDQDGFTFWADTNFEYAENDNPNADEIVAVVAVSPISFIRAKSFYVRAAIGAILTLSPFDHVSVAWWERTPLPPIVTTYDDIMNFIINSTLIPWRQYEISDFETSNNSFAETPDIYIAPVEEIVVTASSENTLTSNAYSLVRPQDTIIFNPLLDSVPDYDNYRDCEYYNDATQNSNGLTINVTWPNTFTVDTGLIPNRDFYISAYDELWNEIEAGIGSMWLERGFTWEIISPWLYKVTLPTDFDLTISWWNQYIYFWQDASLWSRKGFITYRKDTVNNIDTWFDFYGAKMAWYKWDYTGMAYNAGTTYNKRNVVDYNGSIRMSMKDWQVWVSPINWPWSLILTHTVIGFWSATFYGLPAKWRDPFSTYLKIDNTTREDYSVFSQTTEEWIEFGTGLSRDLSISKWEWYEIPHMTFINKWWRYEHTGNFSWSSYGAFLLWQYMWNSSLLLQNVLVLNWILDTKMLSMSETILSATMNKCNFLTLRRSFIRSQCSGNTFKDAYNIFNSKSTFNNNVFMAYASQVYNMNRYYDNIHMGQVIDISMDETTTYKWMLFKWLLRKFHSKNSNINIAEFGVNMVDITYENMDLDFVEYWPSHRYVDYIDCTFQNTVFGIVTWRRYTIRTTFDNANISNNCDISSWVYGSASDVFLNVTMTNTKIKWESRWNTYSGVFDDNNFLWAITNSNFTGNHRYWNVTGLLQSVTTAGADSNTVTGTLNWNLAAQFDDNQIYSLANITTMWAFSGNRFFASTQACIFPANSFHNDFYGMNGSLFDMSKQVIWNTFSWVPNSTNFTASTLIYANYPTKMIRNSAWGVRMQYLDWLDNYVFAAITD